MEETRWKGANSKQQVKICSAKGLLNTQSDNVPFALKGPVLTPVLASNSSSV